ncbi:MAG: DNA-binding response regulator [Parvularculaceae bacterium]
MPSSDYDLICIDDDPMALDLLRVALSQVDLSVNGRFYGSPKKALQAQADEPAALVISDLRMGATSGLSLIEEMKAVAPQSVYMLLSGEPDLEAALHAMNSAGVFRFFLKPAAPAALTEGLTAAIAEYERRLTEALTVRALEGLDRLGMALATFDETGAVVANNDRAAALIDDRSVFSKDANGRVRPARKEDREAFAAFLKEVFDADAEAAAHRVFRINREFDEGAAILTLVARDVAKSGAFATMKLADTTTDFTATPETIAKALSISLSEARVVRGLVVKFNVEDAAEEAGVTPSTARTYLRNVFQKTGVAKQTELVRLVMNAC